MRREVHRASGRRDDKTLGWVNSAFDVSEDARPDAELESFSNSERRRFGTLSAKCVEALLRKKEGELGRRLQREVTKYHDAGRSVPIRHLWRIMARHFKANPVKMSLYTMADLQKVVIHNGNLERFLTDWNVVFDSQAPVVPSEFQREILH